MEKQKTNLSRSLFMLLVLIVGLIKINYSQQINDTISGTPKHEYVAIKMNDGSTVIGQIIMEDDKSISLLSEQIGEIIVAKHHIKKITYFDQSNLVNGEYWFENPNATRYLLGPSAIPLGKGEGYYQNTYLLFNLFNYGITNNISIGCGFDFLTLFGDEINPMIYLTPKIGFPVSKKFHLGGGVLYVNDLNLSEENESFKSMGIGYGVGTIGTKEHNLTFGVGYGWIDGELSDRPIFTVSFMARASKRIGFVSENWIIPYQEHDNRTGGDKEKYRVEFSYGIRFMSEKITVDLAFINDKDIIKGIAIGIPYVDFVVKF